MKMKIKTELERVFKREDDEKLLDEITENYDKHAMNIISVQNARDAEKIEQELMEAFKTIRRWNTDFVYAYFKPDIDGVRVLYKALNEKKKELNIKTQTGQREKSFPNLTTLEKKYSVVPGTNVVQLEKSKKESPLEKMANTVKDKAVETVTDIRTKIQERDTDSHFSNHPLSTLMQYYRSAGLVGETSTAVLQTFGAINKLYYGIVSLSGSGKSFSIDKLFPLLPKGTVHTVNLSSKTAVSYQADEINKADIIYIPELQKAMDQKNSIVTEILKNITEGKDAKRDVRIQGKDAVEEYRIEAGKGVIFTLAIENKFKYDAEFARRVFPLYTDISQDQTDAILKYKASKRHANLGNQIKKGQLNLLKKHIRNMINYEPNYENVFAEVISDSVPRTMRARSYDDYYFNLIEAAAKFNSDDRLRTSNILFVGIEDVYTIQQLYWKQFNHGLLGIPPLGEDAYCIIQEGTQTKDQVYEQMRQSNHSLDTDLVTETLDQLTKKGFLKKQNGKRNPEYAILNSLPTLQEPDWQHFWDTSVDYMKEHYPQSFEKWISKQSQDGQVIIYDVLKDKEKVIANVAK